MFSKIGFAEYQAKEALNQSTIKQILKSPQKWALGFAETKTTKEMDFGSLCHDLVLSPNELLKKYIFCGYDKLDLRKKEHKELKDKADKLNKILVTKNDRDKADELYKNNLYFFDNFLDKSKGDCELSYFGEFMGVECKARFDYISKDRKHIVDLKFVAEASKDGFTRAISSFGYYIQAAFYIDLIGAETFTFLAVEKAEPYMIGLYQIDNASLDFGRDRIKKAIEIFKNKDFYKENYYFANDKESIVETVGLPTYEFYKE